MVVAAYGEITRRVLPFGRGEQVPDEEVADAHEELLNEIKFS